MLVCVDIRKLLKYLDRKPELLRSVCASSPLTTALYFALSTLGSVDSFDVSLFGVASTAFVFPFICATIPNLIATNLPKTCSFNRALDNRTVIFSASHWKNLKTLCLKGCACVLHHSVLSLPRLSPKISYCHRVSAALFQALGRGKAGRTLETLDVTSTFVLDDDLIALSALKSLTKLTLNQCHLLTRKGLEHVEHACPQLSSLGLNFVEIDVADILEVLAGAPWSDPFPLLTELLMQSDNWARRISSFKQFVSTRKHLAKLREWSFIPDLDGGDTTLYSLILDQKGSLRSLNIKLADLELLSRVPDLRNLQLQAPEFNQSHVDTIALRCPKIQSLTLMSSVISMDSVDLSSLSLLEKFVMFDCQLGKIDKLPVSLQSFCATIDVMKSNSCADGLMAAICCCKNLREVYLCTSQAETHTASFTSSAIKVLLETLPSIEDLVVDRELFGRDTLGDENPSIIPFSHRRLRNLKFVCGLDRGVFPAVGETPKLRSFESTGHRETIESLAGLSRNPLNVRSIALKLDRKAVKEVEGFGVVEQPGSIEMSLSLGSAIVAEAPGTPPEKRAFRSAPPAFDLSPASTAETSSEISASLQKLKYLASFSLTGGTDLIVCCLPTFSYLSKIALKGCDVPSHVLAETVSICQNIREVSLDHCSGLDSLAPLRSPKLAYFAISSCPDLQSKVIIDGDSFPALEIVSLSRQRKLGSVTISNLSQLRWATVENCNASSLRVFGVPALVDLALETVTMHQMRLECSGLMRLFLDCGRTVISSEAGAEESPAEISVVVVAPLLRRLSWQTDDSSVEASTSLFAQSPLLEQVDLPSMSTEDVHPLREQLKNACPYLKTVSCSDGDVALTADSAKTMAIPN